MPIIKNRFWRVITASLEEAKKRVITDGWTIITDENKKPEISKKDTMSTNVIEKKTKIDEDSIRAKAKKLWIRNWHNKKLEKLIDEIDDLLING